MAWVHTRFCNLQKRVHSVSQPQVIRFTSCLPMVGGSLRVLWLLPPLKRVSMILLKVALSAKNQIKSFTLLGEITIPLPMWNFNIVVLISLVTSVATGFQVAFQLLYSKRCYQSDPHFKENQQISQEVICRNINS